MHIVTKMAQATENKVWKSLEARVTLSEGVSGVYENFALTLKGPKGEVSKALKYPNVNIEVKGNEVVISTKKLTQRQKKIISTYEAHVNNLNTGVSEGFVYELAVVYAKFPITVEMKGDVFTVKNLLGEKVPRTCIIPSDVKVEIKGGKEIVVSGIDKEKCGQVAASLEQLTRITHMDRRVIQDGIFIVKKPHRAYV